MKTKIIKKLICVFIVIMCLSSTILMFKSESRATTYLIDEAELYSKHEMVSFTYKGIGIGVQHVVYMKDGIEYPAYCLNRNLIGVTMESGAKVTVNKALENTAVWRVITNGYPYNTPSELNCNNELEAFAATKMAVYDALYNYDWNDFEALNEQGRRVIEAAKNISKIAKSSEETKTVGIIEIEKISEGWTLDKIENQYISKTYKVHTNVDSIKYKISVENDNNSILKVVNSKNEEQIEYESNEEFKILIPLYELDIQNEENTEFNISVTAKLRTKPILYGETADSNYQNYALAAGEWEFETATIKENYPNNKTYIKIIKQDAETGETIEGGKFNILDKENNVVYQELITDEHGIAQIQGIMPNTYFIQEIKAPDGYTKYEELIEVKLEFGQTYTVNVKNYKKPKEEEKKVENNEITLIGQKEVALPRTGF